MRILLARIVWAVSTLAHGFWRAGSHFQHVFGAILILVYAVVLLPLALVRRTPSDEDESVSARE